MSYVATLITHPDTACLTEDLVSAVAAAAGGRNTDWLAEAIACDIGLPEDADLPTTETRIRQLIGADPVDVAIQKAETRRKKALMADMDSTMIEQECIDELAAAAGLKDKVAEITIRAMNGEIPFEPALRERVALLKGQPESIIDDVLSERITLASGGRQLVATMNAAGAFTILVSGGFTHFSDRVAKQLGFKENRANVLEVENDVLTGTVSEPVLGREAKITALNQCARQQGLSHEDFIAVGDGANDLGMLAAVGTGVALHAKPIVAAEAKFRIDHGDLTALLYLQGYRQADFVT